MYSSVWWHLIDDLMVGVKSEIVSCISAVFPRCLGDG